MMDDVDISAAELGVVLRLRDCLPSRPLGFLTIGGGILSGALRWIKQYLKDQECLSCWAQDKAKTHKRPAGEERSCSRNEQVCCDWRRGRALCRSRSQATGHTSVATRAVALIDRVVTLSR